MGFLKRLLCNHELEWERNIYGDEINHMGGCRSLYVCKKCGKRIPYPHLYEPDRKGKQL